MNVIVGVALAALIIGSVLIQFWPAIEALSGGAAAFLGALVGAAAGLGAILIGALYNAKLNRDRDDRLREQEAKAIAVAFRAELVALVEDAEVRLHTIADQPRMFGGLPRRIDSLDIPDKSGYRNNPLRVGELGHAIALRIVTAHACADHIRSNVAAARSQAIGDYDHIEDMEEDFRSLLAFAARAINALDAFLGDPASFPDPEALAAEADPAGDLEILAK